MREDTIYTSQAYSANVCSAAALHQRTHVHIDATLPLEECKVRLVLLQVMQDERVAAGALQDAVRGVLGLRRGGVAFLSCAKR